MFLTISDSHGWKVTIPTYRIATIQLCNENTIRLYTLLDKYTVTPEPYTFNYNSAEEAAMMYNIVCNQLS